MRFWRHLDLTVTATAAVVIGTMDMLDLGGAGVTAGATLATLGVLAGTTLAARLQTQRLQNSTEALREGLSGAASADRLLSAARPGGDADLAAAQEIGIIGVTLNRTLRDRLPELRACLRRGGSVRVAVIDDRSGAVAEAARRSTVPDSPEIFTHRLRPTADLLASLAAAGGPGRLEVRVLDFVPATGLLLIDPAEPHGQIRVDIYSHRFAAQEPTLPLRAAQDPIWYAHFRQEFERVWAAGRDAVAAR